MPGSLLGAALRLVRDGLATVPQAINMVSLNPARATGLLDRGALIPGLRADLIQVREKSRKNPLILENFQGSAGVGVSYVEKTEELGGKLLRIPSRDEIPVDVNEILVIELYSK